LSVSSLYSSIFSLISIKCVINFWIKSPDADFSIGTVCVYAVFFSGIPYKNY
jgi:hypothetical protein